MTARPTVPTLPIPLLRDGIAREAARYSLRRVAREVGMSPNGLRDFLLGATPRSSTRAKLEYWLAGQGQVTRPPNVGQFIRLLNHLAVDLSPAQKTDFGRSIGQLLVESYEVRRLSPPRWVQSLLRHYRVPRAKGASEVALPPPPPPSRVAASSCRRIAAMLYVSVRFVQFGMGANFMAAHR